MELIYFSHFEITNLIAFIQWRSLGSTQYQCYIDAEPETLFISFRMEIRKTKMRFGAIVRLIRPRINRTGRLS